MFKTLFSLLCLSLVVTACSSSGPQVRIADHVFDVELAQTDESRTMGLMYREQLAEDAGMLFIFPRESMLSFWMKNTLIPLDILYFDRNKKLVTIQHSVPPCKNTITRCSSYPTKKPAQYVLEINAGLSKKLGIEEGDEMLIMMNKAK